MEQAQVNIAPEYIKPIEDVDAMRVLFSDYELPDLPPIRTCPRLPGAEAAVWRLVFILVKESVFGLTPTQPTEPWVDYQPREAVPLQAVKAYIQKMNVPLDKQGEAVKLLRSRGLRIFESQTVRIRATNGKLVRALLEADATLLADAEDQDDWAYFSMVTLSKGKVGLLGLNGKWVGAHLETDGRLKADIGLLHDWEEFELVELGSHRVGLRAFNNKWVGTPFAGDSLLRADGDSPEDRHAFYLVGG